MLGRRAGARPTGDYVLPWFYPEILDQIVLADNNGFDDVWLSEHRFIEDG